MALVLTDLARTVAASRAHTFAEATLRRST